MDKPRTKKKQKKNEESGLKKRRLCSVQCKNIVVLFVRQDGGSSSESNAKMSQKLKREEVTCAKDCSAEFKMKLVIEA